MSAGFAPFSLWISMPIGVGLWVYSAHSALNIRRALFGSFVTSSTFFLLVLHWSSTYVGWFPWVLLSLFEASILAPVGIAIWIFRTSPRLPLLVGGAFVLDEAVRSRVPWGGFGWARFAFVEPSYFTKIASLGGAPLLTFSIATLAGYLALLWIGFSFRTLLITLAIVIIPLLIPTNTAISKVNVAAVQGNVPRLGLDFNAQREAVLQDHVKTTLNFANRIRGGEATKPELIVWPENASDVDPLHDLAAGQLITQTTDWIGVPILVGGVTENPVQNISVLWVPQIGPTSIYIKQHLAPFGEYLPLRSIAEALVPAAKRIVDMKPGTHTVTHRIGQIRLGDVICFEIIEDALVRKAIVAGRANLVAVQTNSATFGRSPESDQQLAVTRERAIEHARSIISVSTSGKSALITPDGSIIQESGFFKSAVLQANLPITNRLTISDRLGSWPEAFFVTFTVLALLHRVRPNWRRDT
ncbi:MAG TPA: apolipoprotein N-acyltransferase [Candidatus Nanopelagicaceae bacterium]|nr:apolipoprotein N-acyltransferase [Candidatus Nanopelagicaceae bacterium]